MCVCVILCHTITVAATLCTQMRQRDFASMQAFENALRLEAGRSNVTSGEEESAIMKLTQAATQVAAGPDPRIKPPPNISPVSPHRGPVPASQGSMPRSASPLSTHLDDLLATVDPNRSRRASQLALPPGPAADTLGDRPRQQVGPDKWRDSPLFGASPEPGEPAT